MSKRFHIVAKAKLNKKKKAEREAKDGKRPKLPWKKSRDSAGTSFGAITEMSFKDFLINEAKHIGQSSTKDHWIVYLQGRGTDYIGDVIIRAEVGKNNEKDVVDRVFYALGDENHKWRREDSFGRTVEQYINDEIGFEGDLSDWQIEEAEELKEEIKEYNLAPGEYILRDIFS